MRLQSAIFDLDGTLLDSMPVCREIAEGFLRDRGIEPGPEFWPIVRPMPVFESAVWCRAEYGLPETAEEIAAEIDRRFEDYYFHRAAAKPGVGKCLSLLRMEGVWMYVATATERRLAQAALRRAGLEDYFRGMVTCAEAGAGKEHSPAVYERCLTRLRSTKKDTVVFEDSLPAIRTAKAAGFRVAGVYDAESEEDQGAIRAEADYYIRSFAELYTVDRL